ncbi:Site-specific recombinase XerD [Celeribacter neptunius]|uniref:Site-specific recombinase XerD n=2 Tax=Celeribacter neptunius TaxID=588602 RepID=A0A1I3S9R0_9RHOB|nr:Site-specific recombinase XerD [Celeribacter neptunius]
MAEKLPKYVFKRPNGSYRYKRNVPKDLRRVIPKATVYRKLGNTYQEAIAALPVAHAEIEALFDRERRTSDEHRAAMLVRERLGKSTYNAYRDGVIDIYWQEYDDLLELAEDTEGNVPPGVTNALNRARYIKPSVTFDQALREYEEFLREDGKDDSGLKARMARIKRDLIICLGDKLFEQADLKLITRANANAFRDMLLARMSPNSVQRNVGVVKAALNHAILEHDLDIKNVFQALKIKGAGSSKTDRLPITDEQLRDIWPAFKSSTTALSLLLLLTDTGARLSEITGLATGDIDLEAGILHIRENSFRSLKTKTSTRDVPLSQRATDCLRELTKSMPDGSPIFSRYAVPRGNDKASAMLMKRLRSVISDKKITIHSLRHRMKDKLRNTGCPEVLSMAILGHSTNTVAANYGSGYAIQTMRDAMAKVWPSTPS